MNSWQHWTGVASGEDAFCVYNTSRVADPSRYRMNCTYVVYATLRTDSTRDISISSRSGWNEQIYSTVNSSHWYAIQIIQALFIRNTCWEWKLSRNWLQDLHFSKIPAVQWFKCNLVLHRYTPTAYVSSLTECWKLAELALPDFSKVYSLPWKNIPVDSSAGNIG